MSGKHSFVTLSCFSVTFSGTNFSPTGESQRRPTVLVGGLDLDLGSFPFTSLWCRGVRVVLGLKDRCPLKVLMVSGNVTVSLYGPLVCLRDELQCTWGFSKSHDLSTSFRTATRGWGIPRDRTGFVDVCDDRRCDSSLVPGPCEYTGYLSEVVVTTS